MKKLLTMMLCGVAMMAMVACSDADADAPSEDEVRGTQTTKEETEDKETVDEETTGEETTGEENVDEETVDEETTDEGTADEETVEDGEVEEAGADFSLGTTDGLVYENAFIGLGCTLPSEWTFYTDEEIMELNNYTADVMGEEYEEMMKNAQIVYDMYAVDTTGMNSINISLEKIDNRMLAGVDVADIYAQNAAMFVEMYSSMGYSNVKAEPTSFDIGGEEFAGIEISAEISGIALYQKCFGVKCNGYLASIAITAYEDDITGDIVSNFYLVD